MSGNAGFCQMMHRTGSNLDLKGLPKRAGEDRVEGLIAVGLGDRNIVLKASWNRLIKIMHDAQSPIAIIDAFANDSKGIDVEDLGKGSAFADHLLVETVKMLFAPDHL